MKPLKVLVYKGLVSAMKAQGTEPETKNATLLATTFAVGGSSNETIDEVGLVIFESGIIGYYPLDRLEVLPGQFDTEAVISIDVPGAINIAMDN